MTKSRAPVCLACATLLAPCGAAAEWAGFRGPNGAGVAGDARPPIKLAASHLAWETALPPGLSSPVVAGGAVVLTALENGRLVTLAFDMQSGEPRWKRQAPEVPLEKVHETGSPAASTPAADGSGFIVYFGSFGLLAYDHDGTERWAKQLPVTESLYGASTSPVVDQGKVYLVLDDDRNLEGSELARSRLLALDVSTGAVVWETARPFNRSGWSTPTIWRHATGDEIVVLGSGRAYGYDLQTGEELWYSGGFSRETIARPVTGGGRVYLSAALLGGVSDEHPDPGPFWAAVMQFDADRDGMLARSEMTGDFTFPLRPDLPPGHPGFGIPLPDDPQRRSERLDGMMGSIDKDNDGFWTRDEFLSGMTFRKGKPKLVAVPAGSRGELDSGALAWELNRSIPEVPSPIYFDGQLYLVSNGGLLTAVDATDGTIIYRERLAARGHYTASPVIAAGHLFLVSARGTLTVVRCGESFEPVHAVDLGQAVHVTPAIDGPTIFIRTESALRAYRNPAG